VEQTEFPIESQIGYTTSTYVSHECVNLLHCLSLQQIQCFFFFEQQQIQCLVLGRSGEALGYFIEGQIGIQKKIMIEMY
jgi:hypothetical protein